MFRRTARVLTLLLVSFSAQAFSIDLHSHLFIKEGIGPVLRGDFEEPTGADSAASVFRTKMTQASLDVSGLKIIVVSFYAHPFLHWGSQRDALLREITHLEEFVAKDPRWVIAGEPSEARTALAAGKRVFVLSLEAAAGALETPEDQALFIERKKVRIVTFMHLTPDRLGRGVSLWSGVLGFLNSPVERTEAWLKGSADPETGTAVNPYGLSEFGKTLAENLAQRKVWLDLAHASDRAIEDLAIVISRHGQPWLFTHTKLRSLAHTEHTISQASLRKIGTTGGFVGLIPTDAMDAKLPRSLGLPESCRMGIRNYAEEWRLAVQATGVPGAVALGSDFNAPLIGLRGGCALVSPSDPDLSRRGFYRGEDLPRLQSAMRSIGVDPEPNGEAAIARFLEAWERVRGPGKPTSPRSARKPPQENSA